MFLQRNGDRPWAPNSVIIITDGVSMLPVSVGEAMARRMTIDEANLARAQGINIFAIGTPLKNTCNIHILFNYSLSIYLSHLPLYHILSCNAGVGPQISPAVLSEIANKPSYQYTFQVNEFRQLDNILRQVSQAACQTTTPPVPSPSMSYLDIIITHY